ncbi:MAG: c-type cytochrome [Burkholderiales bacterium]|nr:c-type cytochrome [Burkholderiales bacterium]
MFSCRDFVFVGAAALAICAASAQAASDLPDFAGIGRPATPKEVAAWDIDVRPDFKGLPVGSGSVARGQTVWEDKCASCHGVFGDSNEVFNPVVGGTTKDDLNTGHVARLDDRGYPGRTTLMKVSTVSTLWDYINRAMPWTQPKSLTVEEVYGVTAYLLNLGGVVPDDFVLSNGNMAEVQKRVPNRNGMTTQHALWPGKELGGAARPDLQGSRCMTNCAAQPRVASMLPDFARNAHGNLAEQNRLVGAQRGANTAGTAPTAAAEPAAVKPAAVSAIALLQQHSCTACHGIDSQIVGPSFKAVSDKYAGQGDALVYLSGKIRTGGSGVWGAIPMPAQNLPEADLKAIAQWIAGRWAN